MVQESLIPPKDFKYPRTWYLSFSESIDKEDKRNVHHSFKHLLNIPLLITIKMDGSNSRLTSEKVTARNGYDAPHYSFDMLKAIYEKDIKHKINKNHIIFGEWLYAKHSIHYKWLSSYFRVFSIFDKKQNIWLSWKETIKICKELNIETVPILGAMTYETEKQLIRDLDLTAKDVIKGGNEGIVIRPMQGYSFEQHKDFVLKCVRKNHVTSDKHWMHQTLIKNKLR